LYITQNPHCVIYTKISFSLQLLSSLLHMQILLQFVLRVKIKN